MSVWNGITRNFKRNQAVFWLFFLLSTVYISLIPKDLTGIADSDELISMGIQFKAAHPPGYPWLMLIIGGASKIPFTDNIFLKSNFVNALLMALGVTLWYLAIDLGLVGGKQNIRKRYLVWLGALGMGLSVPYLTYGAVTEVLALLLVTQWGTIICALNLYRTQKTVWWWATCGVTVLAIMQHQLNVLLVPGIIYLSYGWIFRQIRTKNYKKILFGLGIGLVVIVLTGSLLSRQLNNHDGWYWVSQNNISGIIKYWMRQAYSGVNIESGSTISAFISPLNFASLDSNLLGYLTGSTRQYLSIIGIITSLWGVWRGKSIINKTIYRSTLATFILFGPIIGLYLNTAGLLPNGLDFWQNQVLIERMYLPGWAWWWWFLIIGVLAIYIKIKQEVLSRIFMVIFTLLILGKGYFNYLEVKQITVSRWDDLILSEITKIPPNSRVICLSDLSCFSLMAIQEVKAQRLDLEIIPVTPLIKTRLTEVKSQSLYPDNPFRLDEAVGLALTYGKRVFVFEMNDFYREHWGIDNNGFNVQQRGLLTEIGCFENGNEPIQEVNKFTFVGSNAIQKWRNAWLSENIKVKAMNKCISYEENRLKAEICLQNKNMSCALREGLSAVQKQPKNTEIRLIWAKILEASELMPLAKREYQIAGELGANAEIIKAALWRLREIEALPWGKTSLHQSLL